MTELEELMKCPVNWADLIPGENWFWSLPYLDWIYSIAQHAVDSDDLPYDSDDSSAGGIDMPSSSIFFMSRLSPWVYLDRLVVHFKRTLGAVLEALGHVAHAPLGVGRAVLGRILANNWP